MFDENYRNDATGATAIPPIGLMKLIIYGYRNGIKSSRKLCELARHNIVAKSLIGNIEPHWTTIADFISRNEEKFKEIFAKVLAYCNELGLVGGETFALDGLRLPSNASIDMSGTEAELKERLEVYRRMAEKHVAKHREADGQEENEEERKRRFIERQKELKQKMDKISSFLETNKKKEGSRLREIKSNVTDNESAMIHSSKGFIQGYIGLAVTDKKNQIIVNAEAVGSSYEGEHLPGVIDKTLKNLERAGVIKHEGKKLTFMADNNYFSEDNLRACEERGVEAIIPDSQYRKRLGVNKEMRYETSDFTYSEEGNCYKCPNEKELLFKGISKLRGMEWKRYQASFNDCLVCPSNIRCIKTKKKISELNRGRIVMISRTNEEGSLCNAMRKKLNTEEYQNKYAYRIQIIEPVFSSISYCKGLNRFSLRGKKKVNGQWNLYCIVHNLSKCLSKYNKNEESA